MITSFDNLTDLFSIINTIVPEGTSKELKANEMKISLSKNNGVVNLKVESITQNDEENKVFDDSLIKKRVENFKLNLDNLDNDVFLEVLEEIKNEYNIKKVDEFLNFKKYDEESSAEVSEIIDYISKVVCDKLKNKMEEIIDLHDKFCR